MQAQPMPEVEFEGDQRDLRIQLTISQELYSTMVSLSRSSGAAVSELLSKALALLVVASEAHADGKQIGIIREGRVETLIDVF